MECIYVKKLTKQDITKSYSPSTEATRDFFCVDLSTTLDYVDIEVCYYGKNEYPKGITIHKGYQGEKDWRICGDNFKSLYSFRNPEEGDLTVWRRIGRAGKYKFSIQVIKANDLEYADYNKFFTINDNHLLLGIDNEQVLSLSFPLNRIIFGAPGTGKSHSLEDSSSFFKNQNIVVDENTKIKNQYSLCNTYGDFVRLGMLYAEHFKTKTVAQIEEEFNFKRAYWIKKGSVLQNEISSISEYTEEEFSEKIVDFIQNIPNRKKETLGAALGYKYSNLFSDASIETLQEEYQAVPTVAYWITYGVQAAQSNIENESNSKTKFIERVTFHPNYSYSQFVGTYKPVQDSIDEKQISYQYVPGPFMRIYASAKQNPMQNFLLIIEEINRANVAAVFGDVFQLLDRKSNGESEYPVAASEDIKKYLEKKGIYEDELSIPSNMYIWATMNSADQGVFPMDTAFKRRWEFEYIGIDDNEEQVASFEIPISETKKVNWNELRKAINNQLITLGVNEDKLLGPFFLNKNTLENALSDIPHFIKLFKSKVLMYLFEDAAKMKVKTLFKADKYIYSEICKEFDKNGLNVFSDSSIQNIYTSDISLKDETLTEEQNEEV